MSDQDRLAEIKARLATYKTWVEGGVYEGDPGREFQNHAPADIDWLVQQLKEWQQAAAAEADLADERGREVARLRDLLARLEWTPNYSPRAACPACLARRDDGHGHEFNCFLAAELHPGTPNDPPQSED
jgi:hypothetical protein